MAKRVLMVTAMFIIGGIENVIMNIIETSPEDNITYDVAVMYGEDVDEQLKRRVEARGGDIHRYYGHKDKSFNFYKKCLCFLGLLKWYAQLLKQEHYDIVHVHMGFGSSAALVVAKVMNIRIRIVHSHMTDSDNKSMLFKLYKCINRWLIHWSATTYVGCVEKASRSLFGESFCNRNKYEIIHNGINLEKYDVKRYDKLTSYNKYSINREMINIVCVGRLCYGKNPLFALKVFEKLRNQIGDVYLTLVGEGELRDEVVAMIDTLGIGGSVKLLPATTPIPELLVVMDYAIFPTRWEGLPLVALEYQAMEVYSFISDCVPKIVDLDLCEFIELEKGVDEWTQRMVNKIKAKNTNKVNTNKLKSFDSYKMVQKVNKLYGD